MSAKSPTIGKRSLIHRLADGVDTLLNWLKWPVAVFSVLMFLPALGQTFDVIKQLIRNVREVWAFIAGFSIYIAIWLWKIRRWRVTFFSTLEHEFTHAIFAWITFHKVTGLKSTWNSGGHVVYKGKGNWLITSSPYFVPTVCIFLIGLFAGVPVFSGPVDNALIGAAFAYHVTSTYRETHRHQTDLKEVGFLWSIAVLPTANLVVNGLVLAHVVGGTSNIGTFLGNVWKSFRSMWA